MARCRTCTAQCGPYVQPARLHASHMRPRSTRYTTLMTPIPRSRQLQRGRRVHQEMAPLLAAIQRPRGRGRCGQVCRWHCNVYPMLDLRPLHHVNPIQWFVDPFLAVPRPTALGTGITLFVAQDPGDIYNTSISLDGGPASIHFAYSPPNNTAEAYNLTLYDIQGLQATTHPLLVGLAPGVSRLLFDYAAVTGDQPAVRASGAAVVTVPSSIMVVVVALAFAALRW
ncbi:hypothetical protein B0H10DRAFT_732150 [Mycena sp. CBHHK59/15]|nr:hypothetical protein B0H10DRAFT_732150 [Mycena sp. CBHHK59/15]